jgi:hypothetical protein
VHSGNLHLDKGFLQVPLFLFVSNVLTAFYIPAVICLRHCISSVTASVVKYKGADKSLARPTSPCILFDSENISFDASLVIYIYTYMYK